MSVQVELNFEDYQTIVSWYQLAFGRGAKKNDNDRDTLRKLCVMLDATIET